MSRAEKVALIALRYLRAAKADMANKKTFALAKNCIDNGIFVLGEIAEREEDIRHYVSNELKESDGDE